MRKRLLVVLSCALLSGCFTSRNIRFGSAGEGGVYEGIVNAYSSYLEEEDHRFSMKPTNTAGSVANVRLLSEKYIQAGIAQGDIIDLMYHGELSSDGTVYQGYSAIAGLYTEAVQIVVLGDSEIDEISDLEGKTVSVGEEESGSAIDSNAVLTAYGLTKNDVKQVNMDYEEASSALLSGEIDAMFVTVGAPTQFIHELCEGTDITLLSIDDTQRNRLLNSYSYFTAYTIPAGTYEGQEEDIYTIGVKATLLVSNDLSESIVEEMTKVLFTHGDEILSEAGLSSVLMEEEAVKGISIPFHQGAVAYYASKGIEVEGE